MLVVITQTTTSTTTMQPCTEEEMMMNQNLSILDEDEDTVVPVCTAILPTTTTTTRGHSSSKMVMRTTGRSFGRVVARVVATASILLVLISTPAVVEGTCQCDEVCPNYEPNRDSWCWTTAKVCFDECDSHCRPPSTFPAFCVCNVFGCNCDGCERVSGACGWTRRMFDDKENEDNCADFNSFTSLSAEGKRNLLARKYCLDDDQHVREDIYIVLLSYTLLQFEGDVFTCVMFNEAYFDVSHLTLCEDEHLVLPVSNKKGKKQKKTP